MKPILHFQQCFDPVCIPKIFDVDVFSRCKFPSSGFLFIDFFRIATCGSIYPPRLFSTDFSQSLYFPMGFPMAFWFCHVLLRFSSFPFIFPRFSQTFPSFPLVLPSFKATSPAPRCSTRGEPPGTSAPSWTWARSARAWCTSRG